jgi:hypothetical protein
VETVAEAGERIAEAAAETNRAETGERVTPEGPSEIVTDKNYQSKKVVSDLAEAGVRSYRVAVLPSERRRHPEPILSTGASNSVGWITQQEGRIQDCSYRCGQCVRSEWLRNVRQPTFNDASMSD